MLTTRVAVDQASLPPALARSLPGIVWVIYLEQDGCFSAPVEVCRSLPEAERRAERVSGLEGLLSWVHETYRVAQNGRSFSASRQVLAGERWFAKAGAARYFIQPMVHAAADLWAGTGFIAGGESTGPECRECPADGQTETAKAGQLVSLAKTCDLLRGSEPRPDSDSALGPPEFLPQHLEVVPGRAHEPEAGFGPPDGHDVARLEGDSQLAVERRDYLGGRVAFERPDGHLLGSRQHDRPVRQRVRGYGREDECLE